MRLKLQHNVVLDATGQTFLNYLHSIRIHVTDEETRLKHLFFDCDLGQPILAAHRCLGGDGR